MRVDDADLLDEFLEEQRVYSSDFQALVLRMVSRHEGNVSLVSVGIARNERTRINDLSLVVGLEHNPPFREKKTLVNRQGGGRLSKSTPEQWSSWRVCLESDEQKHWTSRDLHARFQAQTGLSYSASHWHYLLKHHQKMYYYKPSPVDYRKSPEAQYQLGDRLKATFDALQAMGKDPKSMSIGFADEVGGQLHSNNARFWSFENHVSRPVNTSRSTRSFFGFYALQGKSALCDLSGGKQEDIKKALLEVKKANEDFKGMILIWDNAQVHQALTTWAWENQIYLVFLPAYSPDLNPIERLWKSIKRWINQEQFVKNLDQMANLFHQAFNRFKNQVSFMEGWWIKYQANFSWYNTIPNSLTLQ